MSSLTKSSTFSDDSLTLVTTFLDSLSTRKWFSIDCSKLVLTILSWFSKCEIFWDSLLWWSSFIDVVHVVCSFGLFSSGVVGECNWWAGDERKTDGEGELWKLFTVSVWSSSFSLCFVGLLFSLKLNSFTHS